MEPEFLQTNPDDLVDTGLPREAPFEFGQCQIKSSLLKKKKADAFNDELSRKYPYYDKDYQTKPGRDGGNPFASKRNEDDAIQTQPTPAMPEHEAVRSKKDEKWMNEMGVKTGEADLLTKRDKAPEFLPPREDLKDYGSEEVDEEIHGRSHINEDPDLRVASSLLRRAFNHMENKKQASRKVAALPSLTGLVIVANVKVHDQHLIVNIPRKANVDFTAAKIASIEKEISQTLQVRAKYSHFSINSAFDGTSLEFLLV